MNELKTCPECGAKLSPRTLGGFCPSCTARLTFELLPASSPRAQTMRELDFGDYELIEEVGRGGMGAVYKARQRSLNRIVALKVVLTGRFASKESVERLRAEAAAAAALRHPNIVAIHEIGQVDGQHYFSMDYIAGRSLAEIVRERPMSARKAATYVRAIAEAIEQAHRHGILHRDLKPSNVLVDQHDQPRITDFGLAKRLDEDSDLTVSGKAIGSPGYMPPEQAVGNRSAIGPHSDVYAMGALLYHLLTGRPPFAAETVEATLSQVMSNDSLPPRSLNPGIPRDLETICLKCLEKEPSRRYSSAERLAEDLQRFENSEPIAARPITRPEKLWRWTRRNPRVATLTACLILVFLAGMAGILWQWRRAERHAQTETQQRQRLEEALAHKEIEKAEELFAAGDVSSALARLAGVLRQNPNNHVAASRLLSALTSRNFALPVAPPLPHNATVLSAQFSADGQQVVTTSEDSTARVWDARTGSRLLELQHPAVVRYAEFSPDGERIATACEDATGRIWNAYTGESLTPPLTHSAKVRRVHFSPDGSRVVTASADGTARVWNSQSGQAVTPPLQHTQYVNDAAFSPDGEWVVTASDDDSACVWDSRTGRRRAGPLQHGGDVWCARFSPDGKRLVTASGDKTARVWNATTGQALGAALTHREMVNFASFSPDGTRVVTASWDNTARVWNSETGEPVTPPLEFESDVLYAEFSPDGRSVLTIADAAARVWEAETGAALTELIFHEAPLRHVGGFSPDGGRVVTASLDKTAIVWDIRRGAASPEILAGREAPRVVTCSQDGRWLAAARGREFTAHVWDVSTGQIAAGPLRHEGLIVMTQFSPDGCLLLTACRDGKARIWDVRSGELAISPLSHQGPVNSARFSRDGRRLVTAAHDNTARVWDAPSGREMIPPLQHREYVQWAEFNPDDSKIVTASGDRTAQVWDATTGQPLGQPLRHELGLQSARFSPDGRLIVTASEDGTARLWDAESGQPIGRPLTHRGHVRSAQFSPDGKLVVTTSLDKTARVWDALTSEPLTEPLKHGAWVQAAQFSPDSRRLVTVDLEPVIRIRDAISGHLLLEPLEHPAKVEGALFLPAGRRLATVCGDLRLRLWEVSALPLPAPDWLPELAEAVAAKRFDAQGRSTPVAAGQVVQFRQQLASGSDTNFYAQWARWFFADRGRRTISPFSLVTLAEHPQRHRQ